MRYKLLISICVTCLVLSGCSSKMAYNNMDWLVHWYLDDYVDLDKGQKKLFDSKMAQWLAWHRKEELASYQQHLSDLNAELNSEAMTAQQWQAHFEKGTQHWYRFRDSITPDLVELSQQLSDEQIDSLFDELEKQNKEDEEQRNDRFEGKSAEERIEITAKNVESDLKERTGKLTKQQKAIVAEYVKEFQSTFVLWMEYRRAWQRAAKDMLKNKPEQFSQSFTYLLKHPEEYQSQEYKDLSNSNRAVRASLMAAIHKTLTPKQKKKLNRQVQDMLEDLIDLQGIEN